MMLYHWHSIPDEKYDFNSGAEKVEVKSSSTYDRIHTFSSEQLNPPTGTQALIASIFMKPSSTGISIQDLIDRIITALGGNIDLQNKLLTIVTKTLGNEFEYSLNHKYDYDIARNSLQYYRHQDIHKIEAVHIPNEVSQVRYMSDLSQIRNVEINNLLDKNVLFNSL